MKEQEIIEFWKFLDILQTDFNDKKADRKFTVLYNNDFSKIIKDNITKSKTRADYDICCDSIKKSKIEEIFIKKAKDGVDERIEKLSSENIYLFGFQIEIIKENECLKLEYKKSTFYISPYVWYLNELSNKNKRSSFEDYKKFNENYNRYLIEEKLSYGESFGKAIKRIRDNLNKEIKLLENLNSEENKEGIKEYVVAYFSSNNLDSFTSHESKLFNSYIIDDLELVSENINSNKNVRKYILALESDKKNERIDVKTDRDEIKDILSKDNFPLGKWPSKYFPSLMQQMAINYAVKAERNPFFSVNGPPGTGKTTLLKEIIADTIVKRAIEISKLSEPDNAFKKKDINNIPFYEINEKFNYSILVASCNNAAVENITKELPECKKLLKELEGKPYVSFFDLNSKEEKISYKKDKDGKPIYDTYFNKIESEYLYSCNEKKENIDNSCKDSEKIDDQNFWGIISAPLGKKENIENFFKNIVGKYLELMPDDLIEERLKNDKIFRNAKKEFSEQLKVVEKKLKKLDKCISDDELNRIIVSGKDKEIQTKRYIVTEEYDAEREKLFCKAMNLQKAFVLSSYHLRDNLKLLRKCFCPENEKLKSDVKEAVFTDCFLSLFFLVPVVSSTFASIQNMLRYIKQSKRIGILIIDEAGQATPQQALGAIYRSQKYVIVGDPMQVEPVVTVNPEVYESFLADNFPKIEKYATRIRKESVQTFSDRLNQYGSYIGKNENKKWVGCPLIVHRRCIDPMFKISNKLSYDNTMINAITEPEDNANFLFEKSCWFDIGGIEKGKKDHFIQEQFDFVRKLLIEKKNSEKVFIITPFVSVKEGFSDLEKELKGIVKIGTVHTFQGKEADEVFLVLGCDNTAEGAVKWVNSNIINVAVTRAKYRLYVVGDWDLWSKNPNVAIMQKYLNPPNTEVFENTKREVEELAREDYENGRRDAINEIVKKMIKENFSPEIIDIITGIKVCPNCGIELVKKTGKHGCFLGCPNFKKGCNFTMNLN